MPSPDLESRLSRLRQAMEEEGLDCALVNSIKDIFYYTGHRISGDDMGFLLVTGESSTLFVSTLYIDLQGPGVRIMDSLREVKDALGKAGRVGYDEKNLSVLMFSRLRTGTWKTFSERLKSLRMVKDQYEISQIRHACRNTLRIFSALELRGRTEFSVASDILREIRDAGDTPAFDPLVLAGKRSASIHSLPGMSTIKRGLVIADFGSCHNGYNSDLTRTFFLNPTKREKTIMEHCAFIQAELIDMAVPGTKFSDIQKRYDELMKAKGYTVLHGFGHGLGLSVHERPSQKDVLEKGMVLTVEPGIYVKGTGGCRIEDDVLVSGKPVVLSR